MLRVCGVTFDHSINYGSCLQAYALQSVIDHMEVDGECCEYAIAPVSLIRRKEERSKSRKSDLVACAKTTILDSIANSRKKKFVPFEKEYMHYMDFTDRTELPKLNDHFDAFVCGSDVIWNFVYTKGEKLYFLDFVNSNKYKFSYAASFGKANLDYSGDDLSLLEPADDIYRRYISRLDGVSVREQYAKELAGQFTEKPVAVVCDPTLLLTADEWLRIASNRVKKRKYIFAYSTSTRPNYIHFLKQLQKETRLPIVQITWLANDAIKQRSLTFPTPQQWLALISGAEYVVTNSFHGTAFSVIFKKKFFTAIQGERNVRSNVRLYDFLSELGLEDRLFPETPETIPKDQPDFSIANERLGQLRERSIKYIYDNLEAAYLAREKKQK